MAPKRIGWCASMGSMSIRMYGTVHATLCVITPRLLFPCELGRPQKGPLLFPRIYPR
jgi:hypothetical protein